MIVRCVANFPDELEFYRTTANKLYSGLIYFFQNKDFGIGLKEIAFRMLTGDEDSLQHYCIGSKYSKKIKSYGSLFVIEYKLMIQLSDRDLLGYFKQELIKEAIEISEAQIKDFDLDTFIQQLEMYFDEAIPMVMSGKYPSEGKVLNKDIEEIMLTRFKGL